MKTFVAVLLLSAAFLQAAPADTVAAAKLKVEAIRLTAPLTIDGVLSEPVWQNGAGISQFTQRDPTEALRRRKKPSCTSLTMTRRFTSVRACSTPRRIPLSRAWDGAMPA